MYSRTLTYLEIFLVLYHNTHQSLIFRIFVITYKRLSTLTTVVMFNNWYSLLAMKVLSLSPFDFPFVAWIIKSCRRHLFTGWLSTKPQLKRSTSRTLILLSILCGKVPFSWHICFLWSHQHPISEDAFCYCLIEVPPSVFDTGSRAKKSYLWFLEFNRAGGQKNDLCAWIHLFCLTGYTLFILERCSPPPNKTKKAEKGTVDVPMSSGDIYKSWRSGVCVVTVCEGVCVFP